MKDSLITNENLILVQFYDPEMMKYPAIELLSLVISLKILKLKQQFN